MNDDNIIKTFLHAVIVLAMPAVIIGLVGAVLLKLWEGVKNLRQWLGQRWWGEYLVIGVFAFGVYESGAWLGFWR